MAHTTPHYLRVARALALVSGLAGLPACGSATTPGTEDSGATHEDSGASGGDSGMVASDSGPATDDAGGIDAGGADDASVGDDAGSPADDAAVADAGHAGDAGDPCLSCVCAGPVVADAGPDTCESLGHFECCAVIGPLFPPDLPA